MSVAVLGCSFEGIFVSRFVSRGIIRLVGWLGGGVTANVLRCGTLGSAGLTG